MSENTDYSEYCYGGFYFYLRNKWPKYLNENRTVNNENHVSLQYVIVK